MFFDQKVLEITWSKR